MPTSPFNLSEWSVKNASLVFYLIAALLCAGIYAYIGLPQKEDPDFTFKIMTVQVAWPGGGAREVEQYLTQPIERALQDTPALDSLSSYSAPGESGVFITLQEAATAAQVQRAWQTVRKKLAALSAEFPSGVQAPRFNDEFGVTFGVIYSFSSDQHSPTELATVAERARQASVAIEGVERAELIGVQPEKIYIEFPNATVTALGFDTVKIARFLQSRLAKTSAGEVLADGEITRVRLDGEIQSFSDLQNLNVPTLDGTRRLGEISHIYRADQQPAPFKMKHNGAPAVGLALALADTADLAQVNAALEQTFARLRTQTPNDLQITRIADQPQVVKQAVQRFMLSLLEALSIVLAVSFLSLGWRAGGVVALSIPLVLAGTFVLMRVFGIELQRVSVGALVIALGLLVDDAMIAVEMMKVKLEEGCNRLYAVGFAYRSTAWPMLTGTLITAAAFLPVGLAQSSAGEYTFSLCAVVTLALLVSWGVAVLFTPLIGYYVLDTPPNSYVKPLYQSRFYLNLRHAVAFCLDHRRSVIATTLAACVAAAAAFAWVDQQFFPPSERTELVIDAWAPENSPLETTEVFSRALGRLIKNDPAVLHYTTYLGGSSPRFYLPMDLQLPALNYFQIVIATRDLADREAVFKRLRQKIDAEYPDSGIRLARLENGPPVGFPIQFRVRGADPAQIQRIAAQVQDVAKRQPDTRNVNRDTHTPVRVHTVTLNQDKARSLGLTPPVIAQTLNMLLSGWRVGDYLDNGQRLDIIVRASQADRDDPEFLAHANLRSPSGQSVTLQNIAHLDEINEDGALWRENGLPILTVRADVPDDADAAAIAQRIDQQLADLRAQLPSGYSIEMGGVMEDSDKASASIVAVLPLMAVIILTLLVLQLRHYQAVAVVLLSAPLGVLGAVAALLIGDWPFGFVAMLGMISLVGMIIRNAVILLDQIEQDLAQGLSRRDAILDSTVRRARPILLTAAAALLAMLPLLSSVFWGAMAAVIMGGLLVATLLTLLFLPALYAAWFEV